MSGKRYLLDTNAISALLGENKSLLKKLGDAEWVGISIISLIEIRVFDDLDGKSKQRLEAFVNQIEVMGLSSESISLLERTIQIRQTYRLKLPDAIIAASTIEQDAVLVTTDDTFKRVQELKIFNFLNLRNR
jgi:tRNA(fMet)-specific endonuclease VapC